MIDKSQDVKSVLKDEIIKIPFAIAVAVMISLVGIYINNHFYTNYNLSYISCIDNKISIELESIRTNDELVIEHVHENCSSENVIIVLEHSKTNPDFSIDKKDYKIRDVIEVETGIDLHQKLTNRIPNWDHATFFSKERIVKIFNDTSHEQIQSSKGIVLLN